MSLERLASHGVRVRLVGGQLATRPPFAKLTPEQRAALAAERLVAEVELRALDELALAEARLLVAEALIFLGLGADIERGALYGEYLASHKRGRNSGIADPVSPAVFAELVLEAEASLERQALSTEARPTTQGPEPWAAPEPRAPEPRRQAAGLPPPEPIRLSEAMVFACPDGSTRMFEAGAEALLLHPGHREGLGQDDCLWLERRGEALKRLSAKGRQGDAGAQAQAASMRANVLVLLAGSVREVPRTAVRRTDKGFGAMGGLSKIDILAEGLSKT